MSEPVLIIGNKNYSSWSLRPWLALRAAGIAFQEERIPLYTPDSAAAIARHSPSGKLPVLRHGEVTVWDSLAICEYAAETFPEARLWPADRAARAQARSACAEMHAGFPGLRAQLSMNIRRRLPTPELAPATAGELARVHALWQGCLERYGGPYLFGGFSIADAFYAPLALRFLSYGIDLPGASQAYADTLLALPALREWVAAAHAETETIAAFEPASM